MHDGDPNYEEAGLELGGLEPLKTETRLHVAVAGAFHNQLQTIE